MRPVYYQDNFKTAVHLYDDECEILKKFHIKEKDKFKMKYEKLKDKADGSTRYDEQLSEMNRMIIYHMESISKFDEIIDHYRLVEKIKNDHAVKMQQEKKEIWNDDL